jgi:hypothetical protein
MSVNNNGRIDRLICVAWFICCLIAMCVATVLIVSLYPFTPIQYGATDLWYNTVRAGESITYTAHFKKYTRSVGTMTRYLISLNGGATVTLFPGGLADAKPTDTSKTVVVEIPPITKPGKYKIRWVVVYTYYGIRQVSVPCETPEFTVIR